MTAVARAPSSTRSSIVGSCFGRGPELLEFIWTDIIRPYEDKRNAEDVLVSVRIVDSDGLVSTLRHLYSVTTRTSVGARRFVRGAAPRVSRSEERRVGPEC